MLKVGLIGVGGISSAHIPAWEAMPDAELVALCDVRPEQMKDYQDIKRCYTDAVEMLDKEQLDIVDICLPTYLHAEYAIMVMERGIHVLCEKPISLHAEDVERVYATAERMNVRFMVAHVLRFWREYELLVSLVKNNTYGKVLSGWMSRLNQCPGWSWDNWMKDEERSGLVPYDLHIHDLDFLIYCFGNPRSVTNHRSKRTEQDYICATYDYGDFFVNCESSWYAGAIPFSCGFRFQFERAVVVFENGVLKAYLDDGTTVCLTEQAEHSENALGLSDMGPYANEIRYFTDCVLAGKNATKIQPQELVTVIQILGNFND